MYNYLEDERLLPLEDEEELPQIGRPLPPQISPELRRIIGASSRPPGDPYELRAAKDDRQAVADVVAKQPIPDKPKWWQRLAAGAVGGLAGYTNAAGRTRVDPSGAVDAIMDVPGQQRKLAEWKRDVQGAQAKSAASERSLKDWQTNQDRNSANELRDAQAEMARKHGEYYESRAEMERNQWKIDPKTGDLYNTITSERKPRGVTPEERLAQAKALGFDDEAARFYAIGQPIPAPKAAPAPIPGRDVPLSPEVEAQRKRLAASRPTAAASASQGTEADDIAQAIIDGKQPPDMKGLYRFGGPVRAKLGKAGYDLTTATRDWQAITRHISTLNGPQQERLRQAVNFTYDSLDQIEDLYGEWKQAAGVSGLKVLNRANLAVSKQLGGKAGEIATNLEAQINDLTSELGTVYKGGNSSTDESLRLAGENLKADWNEQTFKRALEQIRKNLQIRRNSINNSQAVGVSPNSPYTQPGGGGAPQQPKADPLGIR